MPVMRRRVTNQNKGWGVAQDRSGDTASSNNSTSDNTGSTDEETGTSAGIADPIYDPNIPRWRDIKWRNIDVANYDFTDPQKFAENFGAFNREQVKKNYSQSRQLALDTLDTELQGLKGYAPAASALKRQETSIDNQFNQQQRLAQINAAMPGSREALAAQAKRAQAYAEGRMPDAATDRALEMGTRSRAADAGTFSGFGVRSAQSQKLSDLMSAEDRFKVAQYGEGLTTQNIGTTANLVLVPTEYSNAGEQIKVTPEVGAGRLQTQIAGMTNEATLVSPGQALSTQVQQNQFKTNLEQSTNQFNAQGQLSVDQFNAQGRWAADVLKFNYDTGYLSAVQAAQQGRLNLANAIEGAGVGTDAMNSVLAAIQNSQNTQAAVSAIGMMPQAIDAVGSMTSGSSTTTGGESAKSVGGANVSTEPSTTQQSSLQQGQVSAKELSGGESSAPPATALGQDSSAPGAYRFAAGSNIPAGYTPVATNSDGSISAVSNGGYAAELARFASSNSIPAGSVSVQNAAIADRLLAQSAGISYVPSPSLQPLVLMDNGQTAFSTAAAAYSGNAAAGNETIGSMALALAVQDPSPEQVAQLGDITAASNPAVVGQLNAAYENEGAKGLSKQLREQAGVDGDSPEAQQSAFMAARTAGMWGNMSPYQRSMAVAAQASLRASKISKEPVPGTETSIAGPLTKGQVVNLATKGVNSYALSRNYNTLSAVADMVGGIKGPEKIAYVAQQAGMLGFGPQGAAVPIEPGYLHKMGAEPAPTSGIGAAKFSSVKLVPRNYKIVAQTSDNKVIALPGNLVHTAVTNRSPAVRQKLNSIATDRHPAQKLWAAHPAPLQGAKRGSVGGSSMISGINGMRTANPYMAGAITAYSLFNNIYGSRSAR